MSSVSQGDQEAPSDGQLREAEADLITEIRRRREAAGLSQAKLATLTEYSLDYISRAERIGRGLASANVIAVIDKALDAEGQLIALRATADAARRHHRDASTARARPDVASRQPPDDINWSHRFRYDTASSASMARSKFFRFATMAQ